jgi:wobble nucleotide-excising tRNase
MIFKRIRSIKSFGIFSDYISSSELPKFARYNLIYGWNGTGKTTLTRLMRCFETGKIYEDFDAATFIIDCEDNPTEISDKNLVGISGRLKVFNKDFIEENMDLDIKKGGRAKPVAHIGKANVEKSQRLKELKESIEKAAKVRDGIADQVKDKKDVLEKLASAIASEIKGINQTTRVDQYKNYNKSDVKKQYEKGGFLTGSLTQEEHDKLKAAINAENKVAIDFTPPKPTALKALSVEIEMILKTQILATDTIKRLKENLEIENWVRQGTKLHPHIGGVPCEFCGNAVTEQRLDELGRHFSGEREKFLNTLNEKISVLEEQKKSISSFKMPNWTEFFPELQDEYKLITSKLGELSNTTLPALFDKIILALIDKKRNPYSPMFMLEADWAGMYSIETEFLQRQSDIQALIWRHNKKVSDFDSSIKEEKEKLERSVLVTKKPRYEGVEKEIEELMKKHSIAVGRYQELKDQKNEIEKEIQETRIACETINSNLKDYLGHEEIKFEDFKDGYLIKRNGEIAKNLSEGEKTAIAFVYFIATLEDSFDPANSVVIIDDPVSSLDANNIHHAFHFMVAHTKEAGQLFILTHNFSFLRKIKQWFQVLVRHGGFKEKDTQYYQILCALDSNGKRVAHLTELDPLLRKYDSEYHYLFKILMDCNNKLAANDDISYEELYPLVNVGRKTLETFLGFKYPYITNIYLQLTNAKVQATGDPFDRTKAELLYGLLNDGSHAGFDTGGFDTFRNSPEIIKRAIKALLDFIQQIDPVHYENLCKCSKRAWS